MKMTNKKCLHCDQVVTRAPKRQLCMYHLSKYYRFGDPLGNEKTIAKNDQLKCLVCDKVAAIKSTQLCQSHHHRFKRYGDPLVARKLRKDYPIDLRCIHCDKPALYLEMQLCKSHAAKYYSARKNKLAMKDSSSFNYPGGNNPDRKGRPLSESVTRSAISYRARKFKKSNCEKCGTDKKLEIHHIDRDWSNNDLSNLKTLCRTCHAKQHHAEGYRIQYHGDLFCYLCDKPVYYKGLNLCSAHGAQHNAIRRKYNPKSIRKRG